MKWMAMIVAMVLAAPAQAQDLRYSIIATADCLTNAGSALAVRRACVGVSANRCMAATPDGSTTYGMGACLDQELQFWDARLNSTYKVIRNKTRARDAGKFASEPSTEDALRAAQRAWITWRDATCDFERSQWGGGTGGGPATLACLLRLTGEQALYLEQAWIGD